MIITISGTPGSGKSTVAKKLKEKLGFEYIYSGEIFRELANEHKMSLEEFGKYCEENSEIDKELDKKQVEILKTKDDIILEGRLSGWLSYKNNISSFKIFLDADIEVRTKRIIKRENGSFEERKREIVKREKSEKTRYNTYYGIDLDDISIYDLVLNSENKTADEIVDIIISKM
jgi:predicted cytidylate kinase